MNYTKAIIGEIWNVTDGAKYDRERRRGHTATVQRIISLKIMGGTDRSSCCKGITESPRPSVRPASLAYLRSSAVITCTAQQNHKSTTQTQHYLLPGLVFFVHRRSTTVCCCCCQNQIRGRPCCRDSCWAIRRKEITAGTCINCITE